MAVTRPMHIYHHLEIFSALYDHKCELKELNYGETWEYVLNGPLCKFQLLWWWFHKIGPPKSTQTVPHGAKTRSSLPRHTSYYNYRKSSMKFSFLLITVLLFLKSRASSWTWEVFFNSLMLFLILLWWKMVVWGAWDVDLTSLTKRKCFIDSKNWFDF